VRAVDRVDHPGRRARHRLAAAGRVQAVLLTEHVVAGPGLGQTGADRLLGGDVGLGHPCPVALAGRCRVTPVALVGDAAPEQRQLAGQLEVGRVVAHTASADRRSSDAAARMPWRQSPPRSRHA
jgi:hypothetical protein